MRKTGDVQSIDAHTVRYRGKVNRMYKYEFSLILKGSIELTEEIADKLFECGCDDGTPGTCNEVFSVDFNREATSLEAAINSAIKNVEATGCNVERVEIQAESLQHSA